MGLVVEVLCSMGKARPSLMEAGWAALWVVQVVHNAALQGMTSHSAGLGRQGPGLQTIYPTRVLPRSNALCPPEPAR